MQTLVVLRILAEKHPDESRADDERLTGRAQVPLLGDSGAEHTAEKDFVEIKESADSDKNYKLAMPGADW